MSRVMLLLSVGVLVLWTDSGVGLSPSQNRTLVLQDTLERSPFSLNDMFREVEELMEDTQHLLQEVVDQIKTESAKTSSLELRLNLQNESKRIEGGGARVQAQDRGGGARVQAQDGAIKDSTASTEDTQVSHVPIQSSDHECMVDEDCGELRYCHYELHRSKCVPCIPTDMPCVTDAECCSDQLCVWGQCSVNVTRGTIGTICNTQNDCRPQLCCAFITELLFPVCNLRPQKGQSCLNLPNLLMDMLSWDQEGPLDHCPCAHELQCQTHGRGSVCGP